MADQDRTRRARNRLFGATLVALATTPLIAGCVTHYYETPLPPAPVAARAPPDTHVYVYPAAGQSEAQLDRDRYECHQWAVHQTGFDPSTAQVAPHQRVAVVAAPAGSDTVAGAATGALLGAAVSRPREAGGGMILGALTGAILGAASDQARTQQAAAMQQQLNAQNQGADDLEQRAAGYRRALAACLQGRSYTIR